MNESPETFLDNAIADALTPTLDDLIDEGWHRDDLIATLRRIADAADSDPRFP